MAEKEPLGETLHRAVMDAGENLWSAIEERYQGEYNRRDFLETLGFNLTANIEAGLGKGRITVTAYTRYGALTEDYQLSAELKNI